MIALEVQLVSRAQAAAGHRPGRVAVGDHARERLVERAVVVSLLDLHEDRRPGALERARRAGQDGRLVALDVALDQGDAVGVVAELVVERREADADRLGARGVAPVLVEEGALGERPALDARDPQLALARAVRQRDGMEDDRPPGPGQGAQPRVALRVGLEGVHAPARPGEGRHPAGEQAHRGPDVGDHLP